jgi:hypothetical protein
MSSIDRVKCMGCGREVVPQLMVEDRDRLYKPRITHLCPFCGAILHESGGKIDRGMLAFLVGFIGLSFLIMHLLVFMKYGR